MATSDDRLLSTLNELIVVCRDGEQGFKTAADHVQDPELRRLFTNYGLERADFAHELTGLVERLSGEPERSGSMTGALHRTWLGLKSSLTAGNDASVLAAAESGEDVAKAAYEKALATPLTPDTRSVIERQFTKVKAAHDRVRDLKHAA